MYLSINLLRFDLTLNIDNLCTRSKKRKALQKECFFFKSDHATIIEWPSYGDAGPTRSQHGYWAESVRAVTITE